MLQEVGRTVPGRDRIRRGVLAGRRRRVGRCHSDVGVGEVRVDVTGAGSEGLSFSCEALNSLVAHPDVTVEVGTETIPVRARADAKANFDEYAMATTRDPVGVLERP